MGTGLPEGPATETVKLRVPPTTTVLDGDPTATMETVASFLVSSATGLHVEGA